MSSNFADRLNAAILKKGNPCVVGLDPRPEMFPPSLQPKSSDVKSAVASILAFNQKLIEVSAPLVPAVKPQVAFYERYGAAGYACYEETIAYAHKHGLLVIGDVKRGDIGSTAEAYALGHLGTETHCADSITVNPLFGTDGVKPFLDLCQKNGKGIFFLVQTSNPTSKEIQGLQVQGGGTVSEKVASLVEGWGVSLMGESGYSAAGAVVGATHPRELVELRKRLPKTIFLLPGYGAQGGKASDLVAAFDKKRLGGLVSSSRGVMHAYQDPKFKGETSWEMACEKALRAMIEDINAA